MARKIDCFVSFSATDGNERNIRFLLSYLSEKLDNKVNFKVYFEQKSGIDLQTFMKDIKEAEAVIALFTPDYKYKTDNKISSGVLTEHMHIVDRLERNQGRTPLLFIPIFWSGPTFEAATPNFYTNRNFARDLKQFHAYGTDDPPYLPARIASAIRPEIGRIVADLENRWEEADPTYSQLASEIDSALLSPSAAMPENEVKTEERPEHHVEGIFFRKSERTAISIDAFSERFFVKTAAFRAIGLHHKMAFTGRKGSGKTTLLKVYKYLNRQRYFKPIDIEVNDWNLHYLLEDLTFKPTEGDLYYTAEESKIFDFIWPVFLTFCMVRSLHETESSIHISELIPNQIYADQFIRSVNNYESLFQLAIGVVRDFMSSCINQASSRSESEFKADLLRLLNVNSCVEHLLGTDYRNLVSLTVGDVGQRRFLFCLDRFDTEIQKYRKDLKDRNIPEEERRRRERREVFWIQGLVELIDHLRSPDQSPSNHNFYKVVGPMLDFCVPLPKDRLYEVQLRRRDSIISDIQDEINWQPYELLTMLRKRLQNLWNISDAQIDKSKHTDAIQRYDKVIEQSGRRMPRSSEIRMNGRVFSLDLFLNVLRHTFFRPRDVIIFYSRIVLGVEISHRRSDKLSAAAVSRMISEQTFKIVEDEFLQEFSDTFKNIREVLHVFRGSSQLLELHELGSKIQDLHFEIYAEEDIIEIGAKIRFLYELGFLGVCAKTDQLGSISTRDYEFYFFNPRIAQNLEHQEVLQSLKFAIHPVFIEYLTLRLNAPEPVMNFSWDRIDELDTFD